MASYQYIYVMKDLSKTFQGGKKVLNNIYLSFLPGAKIGVLGPNGSGKSTLLKIMAGVDKEFQGEAWAADGCKVGYLPQEPQLNPDKTVYENVMEAMADIKALLDKYNDISNKFAEVTDNDEMTKMMEEQGDLQTKIENADGWNLDNMIELAMDALRCPPGDMPVANLSGGEKRRVALCKLLLEKPDMLLLDEPTNHLDAESVAWLQRHLSEYKGTVVMVTHDRYFLDNVTGWILELDRGSGIPYEGNYSSYLEKKSKRLSQEGREQEARQKNLSRELEWVRQSPKARQAKSKARISSYDNLLEESKKFETTRTAQIVIPLPPRLGQNVVDVENVSKGYDERLLFEGLSFSLPPGGIVGVIGANGAGKTTLFRMIAGEEKPDSGTLVVGDTVEMGYVDQSRDSLDASKNVWEEISSGNDILYLGKREMPSRAYVGSFGFRGPDQQKKVGVLSGGERNRVHLAKMLKKPANLLLL
ncbi:MAG: energy-dependent translational throttle protein EttA, partial [Alphaproteobacteria bacterium]|nr:energy-dependent translational throttle protein EttA [Alphaproteobacteria bacterium]